jgi:hypothetical protein
VSGQQATKSARGAIDYQIQATPNGQGQSNKFIIALGNLIIAAPSSSKN